MRNCVAWACYIIPTLLIYTEYMPDLAKPNYELAFHVTPNLEEADVQKTKQELEKIVTSHGGIVSFSKDPERTRLAYPIRHQTNTYFGYLNFNLESPEIVSQIRDELRLNQNILRFLILKQQEFKSEKEGLANKLAMAEKRRARAIKQAEKLASPGAETPKIEEAELEKKLEEIIEKL